MLYKKSLIDAGCSRSVSDPMWCNGQRAMPFMPMQGMNVKVVQEHLARYEMNEKVQTDLSAPFRRKENMMQKAYVASSSRSVIVLNGAFSNAVLQ